jgi:hypothetical protein
MEGLVHQNCQLQGQAEELQRQLDEVHEYNRDNATQLAGAQTDNAQKGQRIQELEELVARIYSQENVAQATDALNNSGKRARHE